MAINVGSSALLGPLREIRSTMDSGNLQDFVSKMTASQGDLRAFITSLMPGNPDVEDVLQETNIKLWQERGKYDPAREFCPWAPTIAKFEVLHYRSRTKKNRRLVFSPCQNYG